MELYLEDVKDDGDVLGVTVNEQLQVTGVADRARRMDYSHQL